MELTREEVALRFIERQFVTKNLHQYNIPRREELAEAFRFADVFLLWAAGKEEEAIEVGNTKLTYPERKLDDEEK